MAPTEASEAPEESPAQRQARLRREKRNAKLQAGGSERLNKITSLSGRTYTEDEATPSQPPANPLNSTVDHRTSDDPPEVDISSAFKSPLPYDQQSLEDQQALLRQMLRQPPPNNASGQSDPQQDPMMAMMQQMMMGGQGAPGSGAGGMPDMNGLPPGLANMFGGGQGAQQQGQVKAGKADYIWRIVHGLFALAVAVYAALNLNFESSLFSRTHAAPQELAPRLFWTFATGQLVLQSTRYIVDGGQLPPGGWLGTIGSFLPEPYANYVRIISRYSIIYTAIMSDAMIVVFVLGAIAWYNGHATS